MEFFMMLLAFGWLFWIGLIVGFIAIVFAVASERHVVSIIAVLITTVGMFLLLKYVYDVQFSPIEFIKNNVGTIVAYLGVFLGIGVVYSVYRWSNYAKTARELLNEYIAIRKLTTVGSQSDLTQKTLSKQHIDEFARDYLGYRISYPLKVSEHKAKITFWMIYWPFIAWKDLIVDPIEYVYNMVFDMLRAFLQSISDRTTKDLNIVE